MRTLFLIPGRTFADDEICLLLLWLLNSRLEGNAKSKGSDVVRTL
jgi:hypothetical protein